MGFRLTGLAPDRFRPLFSLSDAALRDAGAVRLVAGPGFPCRISLRDAPVGEPVLLLTHEHLPGPSAYRASGPIFVSKAETAGRFENAIPPQMRARLYSVRAYDETGWMLDAEVTEGVALEPLFERFFAMPQTAFLHLHHARRGCFACRVERA
ncbi:MAG: DUF1203 domain-containing protein [Maricaulaceae bacterium]|nr:DUF1203 domain-containing protein [Maricaulaceae bacterium]